MERNLYTILCKDINQPRHDLPEEILAIVYARAKRDKTRQLWLSISVCVVSFAVLIPAVADMSVKFRQSGFYEYTSLLFSDGGALRAYGQDFAMALGESIPTFSIIVFLIIVAVLLWSIRNISKTSRYQYIALSTN